MNRWITLLMLWAAVTTLGGCHLLTPDDPPLEPPELLPDEVAWDKLDIARAIDFTDIARIDCGGIKSTITASGKCLPYKMPEGMGIRCPLLSPATELIFACFPAQDAPSVYLRISWGAQAKEIGLDRYFGPCHLASAGPPAEEPRHAVDPGFRVCLFDDPHFLKMPDPIRAPEQAREFVSELRPDPVIERPAGIYLDFTGHSYPDETLSFLAQSRLFDGPFSLVLDARFLHEEEKIQALSNVLVLFSLYRDFAGYRQSEITQ